MCEKKGVNAMKNDNQTGIVFEQEGEMSVHEQVMDSYREGTIENKLQEEDIKRQQKAPEKK